jgi:hypothetical protein
MIDLSAMMPITIFNKVVTLPSTDVVTITTEPTRFPYNTLGIIVETDVLKTVVTVKKVKCTPSGHYDTTDALTVETLASKLATTLSLFAADVTLETTDLLGRYIIEISNADATSSVPVTTNIKIWAINKEV